MRRLGLLAVLALVMAFPQMTGAALADTSKDCEGAEGLKDCITLYGVGPDVDQIKAAVTNNGDIDVCGTVYVSKNSNIDWLSIPECVAAASKVAVFWSIDHAPFEDGTVFCSQFVTITGILSGQPCVVTPIPPPKPAPENTSKCDPANGLKQCIFIAGFIVHVDYVKGTEYGIPTGSICGYEYRYEDGAQKAKSRLCVPKGTNSSTYVKWNVNRNYKKGTDICTRYRTDHGTWSGRPCGVIG